MFSLLVAASLTIGSVHSSDSFTYHVQNCRPSKMLQKMRSAGEADLIPKEVTARVDDFAGELIFDGPKEAIDEVKRYFELFDIQPQYVRYSVSIVSPLDHYRSDWQGAAANGRETTITDGETGIGLKVSARINGDGTLSIWAQFSSDGFKLESAAQRSIGGVESEYMLHGSSTKVQVPKGATLLTFQKMSAGYATVRLSARIAR